MLVKSVYERPESGLCAKLCIMTALKRGTRHARKTMQLTAPIAQHIRFPSEAFNIGWNTCTYDQVSILFVVSGSESMEDLNEARQVWSV